MLKKNEMENLSYLRSRNALPVCCGKIGDECYKESDCVTCIFKRICLHMKRNKNSPSIMMKSNYNRSIDTKFVAEYKNIIKDMRENGTDDDKIIEHFSKKEILDVDSFRKCFLS